MRDEFDAASYLLADNVDFAFPVPADDPNVRTTIRARLLFVWPGGYNEVPARSSEGSRTIQRPFFQSVR